MILAVAARRIDQMLLARMAAGKGCLMEITNLGKADGLPPVDWAAAQAIGGILGASEPPGQQDEDADDGEADESA